MTGGERWTAQTEDLVAATWWANTEAGEDGELPPAMSLIGAKYRRRARAVLTALAAAGLLLTPEGEAVIAAARNWRAMRSGTPTKPKSESAALIAAVDALPEAPDA